MKTMRKLVAVLIVLMTASLFVLSAAARDNTTVEAPYFNVKPNIDGVISTAEWGQPTGSAIVYTGKRDYKYDDDGNVMCSPQCFMDPSRVMYINDISFDFWLRWDEQFFYIAVVSKDKYGVWADSPMDGVNPNGYYSFLWNGDALQFGIDPAGANSTGDPAEPFIGGQAHSKYTFVLGFLDYIAGTSGVRNDANKDELVAGAKTGMSWNPGVWPTIGGEANTEAGYMSYEVAIPYSGFDGSIDEGKTNGFGVTVARVSATPVSAVDEDGNVIGADDYECWLSWGDGVMGSQKDQLPEYRCGSNSVILVDTPAVGAGAAETPTVVTPAAAEDPEEPEEAEEPAEDETSAEAEEELAEGEETAEEPTEDEEETAEDETEAAEDETEAEDAEAEGEDETEAEAEETPDKSAQSKEAEGTADEPAEKSGLPVGAIIGIVAAVVVIAAVVIAVLAKKKKN